MKIKGKAIVINKIKRYVLTGNYRPEGFEYFGKKVTVLKETKMCRCRLLEGEEINGFNFITLYVNGGYGFDNQGNVYEVVENV